MTFGAPTALKIQNDEITITGKGFIFHTLEAEEGKEDELIKINGGTIGDLLVLQPAPNHKIAVKKGSSIRMTADFSFDNEADKLLLICNAENVWHELSRASNG